MFVAHMENTTRELKVVVVGKTNVGKTSLLRRYVGGCFQPDEEATIGVDFKCRMVERSGQMFKLKIWDTAGQERYSTITHSFYRGANIGIIVYDISDRDSFYVVKHWYQQLETYLTKPDMVKLLVGNKKDKYCRVLADEGREFACNKNMMFTEASALSKDGVEYMFEIAVNRVLARPVVTVDSIETGFSLDSRKLARRRYKCKNCQIQF